MDLKIQRLEDKRVVSLPDKLLAELGWDAGDMLTVELLNGGFKFTRTNNKHNEGMQIARRAMEKYRKVFEVLAKR